MGQCVDIAPPAHSLAMWFSYTRLPLEMHIRHGGSKARSKYVPACESNEVKEGEKAVQGEGSSQSPWFPSLTTPQDFTYFFASTVR